MASTKKRGQKGNGKRTRRAAQAAGAVAGGAVGPTAGRGLAGAFSRARAAVAQRQSRRAAGIPSTGGVAGRARAFINRVSPREQGAARAGNAVTARQAGAIQAPHNSPPMSSFPPQGPKGVMRGTTHGKRN